MTEKGDPGIAKPTVYIETSVVSYLTGWPSRDLVVAAQQHITREWWRTAQERFQMVASQVVLDEAGAGNPEAARVRLAALASLPILDATEEAEDLALQLVGAGAIPVKAADDAAHVAIAVTNGIGYLVTWNFRHIANAVMRSRIETTCREAGYEPTIICAPGQLTEPHNE